MVLDVFKPILTALALPPASPLLFALLVPMLFGRSRVFGRVSLWLGLLAACLFSCSGTAVWLSDALLPPVAPTTVAQLKAQKVQVIVVLGGGMQRSSPEYGSPQLSANSLQRVRYGAWLGRQSGLPLAFSGGVGWASTGTESATEAEGA